MIVEDEPQANRLLGMLVQFRGYQARSVHSGREALEAVELELPDLIFLDLMLPDINGYEICKTLKSTRKTSLIPLIIVTARVAAENRIESFCIGADDYIAKPYTPDQVFQAIERADQWRRESLAAVVEGSVAFDEQDDGETLRRLGQLRSLVFGRGCLSFESTQQLGRAVKEVWCRMAEWARLHPDEPASQLRFLMTAERLELTFHNPSGWIEEVAAMVQADSTSALHAVQFDQIDVDQARRHLTLIKEFRTF